MNRTAASALRVRPAPRAGPADILPAVLGAGLIFLAIIIVVAMLVTGVGIFLRMWNLRRR